MNPVSTQLPTDRDQLLARIRQLEQENEALRQQQSDPESERQQAEQQICERKAFLRSLGDNLPEGMIFQVRDVPGAPSRRCRCAGPERGTLDFTFLSAGWQSLLGASPEEFFGLPLLEGPSDVLVEKFLELVAPSEREHVRAVVTVACRERKPFDLECQLQLQAVGSAVAETKWVHVRAAPRPVEALAPSTHPRRDPAPEIVWDGIAIDITPRKQAELERQEFDRKLHETQRLESLGVLAGGIAHDFNNLLCGVLGNADLARLMLPVESDVLPLIEQIEQSALRAAGLCTQMLAYAGKGHTVVESIDLNAILREITALLHASVSRKADLTLYLAEDLPAVWGDATQLRQVVMNLVINASEALPEEGGLIAITTTRVALDREQLASAWLGDELPEGEYICLEVIDTGCGMDEATQARIFEPFFTTKFTGRGLGLSAVLGIVRGHKGTLVLRSRPGQGTTFRLYFPVAESLPGAMNRPLPVLASGSSWQGEGTVLVVEDEDEVRDLVARIMESFGFHVLRAADGREAVERYRQERGRIRLVMLDLLMPRLDGEQTLEELHSLDGSLPVILMSGFSDWDLSHRFAERKVAGFLSKPFTRQAVQELVQSVVSPPIRDTVIW